eukprot:CAMPEP_0194294342 /NCGR_PEP_ID=MMETSP0169-20130528/50390_1 /TAXON_ID=218684 /ORGANISM="Corethron pennatum, Strain L29A3" /LENGTH=108 /DNA_ID=CAMNT_0039043147 /DNA_START=1 /DNA_END=327 /DNA_ORIENTATION=-
MDLLNRWGDRVPYEYRNIYKTDWNWNPIDEAPLHSGSEDHWPDYEGIDETDLETLLKKLPENHLDEGEYWQEYWKNGNHDDDDEDYDDDYDDENDDEKFDEEDLHGEL